MHSFRVSGGEERHQFFLSEKIAARLEEEHQRETPTKTPKPTKRSHQRKDFDNTTDAALLSLERERERDLKTYYSGFILIRVCLVSVFILFKVKRQRHLFPSFFTSESRQRDKGVNLFRTINFRLSFLQWLFFCEKLKETQRE